MPYKDFQVNEILTAADVNDYLMKQAVMTFADSTARATALGTPTAGMMSFLTGSTAVEVYSGSTAVGWTPITGGGGGVTVGTAAPSTPAEGDLWWNSDDGLLYVYYDDGTSQQWVDAASPKVFVSDTAPTGYDGQLWLDSTDGSMYVYYTDPGGANSQWIGAVSRSGGILQVVSTAKTDTFSSSSTSYTPITGLSATITPRSTSSKILVMVQLAASISGTESAGAYFKITGGNTSGYVGDAAGSRRQAVLGAVNSETIYAWRIATLTYPINYLDSPSTTSTITYQVEGITSAGTFYVNRSGSDTDATNYGRGASSITLIEVAG